MDTQQTKEKRIYTRRKIEPRKKREDKEFRKTFLISRYINENGIDEPTLEEIKEFRKEYYLKYWNVNRYIKKHPEFEIYKKQIVNDLPTDIEKLRRFRVKDWIKSNVL